MRIGCKNALPAASGDAQLTTNGRGNRTAQQGFGYPVEGFGQALGPSRHGADALHVLGNFRLGDGTALAQSRTHGVLPASPGFFAYFISPGWIVCLAVAREPTAFDAATLARCRNGFAPLHAVVYGRRWRRCRRSGGRTRLPVEGRVIPVHLLILPMRGSRQGGKLARRRLGCLCGWNVGYAIGRRSGGDNGFVAHGEVLPWVLCSGCSGSYICILETYFIRLFIERIRRCYIGYNSSSDALPTLRNLDSKAHVPMLGRWES